MLLELCAVTKKFSRRGRDFNAVDQVSLEIDANQFVVISGKSGNGKTTLLNLMMGLLRPSSGTVQVAGQDLSRLSDRELSQLRRFRLGMVTQQQTLVSSLNVLDNVVLPATLPAQGRSTRKKSPVAVESLPVNRALDLLEKLDIADLSHAWPAELSGGEMRRVAIARALMTQPEVLLADEPTGDLDEASTAAVLRLFRELTQEGRAVVMVTHDTAAYEYCNRRFTMLKGCLEESR
ncbi:ABC transporter ATP-binding protein [Mobiluncus curtisii]|uniref:ABC transporter ATP-binding protein n=1 Tax=Mobiluncus curtisii TaxID=2051 RepID=A0A7Y0UHP3_9ACTO|nr:ABC transporter ATP-binding protein [Mobiluncus curtisii]EFL94137.1 ABC transporter, ATP-binding protein [Mobiluncus curtisii subsp. curtisii ATCC 35241]MCU9987906.1 ABC transporter ATP-binding protein [Mobiluncus curtisii]NMW43130.1 ABC transporter ATP-binding protein [Mobiluncus curtisii]NMW48370.1 ABC transporter ATP-binding protein [Mobiluncus curtisii]NMW83843.1 ABC transporter ATP-binding protein [Mobiluncus curtisii]